MSLEDALDRALLELMPVSRRFTLPPLTDGTTFFLIKKNSGTGGSFPALRGGVAVE
jgi:hypothetical protein